MKKSGYESLLVYRLSTTIYDLTVEFCKRFLSEQSCRRIVEQMVHAARSGKQNIVEGAIAKSFESNLKLTSVARASFGELLEDFKDFVRQRKMSVWAKTDRRVIIIRNFRESVNLETNLTNLANWTNLDFAVPENYANMMICLIYKETYLLDNLLRSQEQKFLKEGGFRERLFKKRMEYRRNRLDKLD